MSGAPRLSIGLPVYNGENYLAQSLDALLGQSYADFELIVSDNASTDGTAEICQRYLKQDPRIRYFRQARNIGSSPNHNFVLAEAGGELFKWASNDDLYALDLLERCVDALDEYPQVVLAHSWTALIDSSGAITEKIEYPLDTASPRAPERFLSMLYAKAGDDMYGVIRTDVLRRTALQASYHHADRAITAEMALQGPFYQVPDWLYFRRDHPDRAERSCPTVRTRCTNLDPRRANRLRHPTVRLYAEYLWGYISAIQHAPLSREDRRECYRHLARWAFSRALPGHARREGEPGPGSARAPLRHVSGPPPTGSGLRPMRVSCIGGGPAGLYFALVMKLRDPGHDITVYERTAEGSAHGWGVTFGEDLLETLYRTDPASARQVEQAAFNVLDQVVDVEGTEVPQAGGTYSISRQRLLSILADRARSLGARIEFGREVTSVSQLPAADLVVACDGVNSPTRQLAGSFQTDVRSSSNRFAWLGTVKVFKSFRYAFAHTRSGWVWAYAYGIDAQSSTFVVECPQETWAGLGFDAMAGDATLALLEKLFERQLDGHHLAAQGGTDVRWQSFRTVTNRSWHDARTVLVGDAAHTTHFTIGSGMKLALEDVILLAGNLQHHGDLEPALRSYEKQRRAALVRPAADARCSAQWFENLSRYIDLKPEEFAAPLRGRRSPILPLLPPRLYCTLHRVTEEVAVLRALRRRVVPGVKTLLGRRNAAPPGDSPTTRLAPDAD
jgi:2-polyprenyl-6-methoxyphenol hydroxylase-like FAD-dependent oxidoreductase/glycosyltransferase involved in cell wall biosynthesis